MAYNFVAQTLAKAGAGTTTNLIASATGESITVWQLILSGSTTDTITLNWTAAAVATSAKIFISASNGTVIMPYGGAAWAAADVATAVTFNAASTTTLTVYYTQGIGG